VDIQRLGYGRSAVRILQRSEREPAARLTGGRLLPYNRDRAAIARIARTYLRAFAWAQALNVALMAPNRDETWLTE
jgi:hypothetical protein